MHGNNDVYGATIFPQNVGLGAAHDPALMRLIGGATAEEVRAIGLDWTFGPTLAVVSDNRWGRSYESYSSDPALVRAYARAMVLGLQGQAGHAGSFSTLVTSSPARSTTSATAARAASTRATTRRASRSCATATARATPRRSPPARSR